MTDCHLKATDYSRDVRLGAWFSCNVLNPTQRKMFFDPTWEDWMEFPSWPWGSRIALSMDGDVAPHAKLHLVDTQWNNSQSFSPARDGPDSWGAEW
jgi:hypothetical protein